MLTARDVMTHPPIVIEFNESVADAARLMADRQVGFLPVVDDDVLVGVVTDRDLALRVLACDLRPNVTSAASVADPAPVTVGPDTPVRRLRHLLDRHGTHRIVVVDAGRVLGVVSRSDLARANAGREAHRAPASARQAAWRLRSSRSQEGRLAGRTRP